ncbi:hypothetical protein GH714_007731 [Hevea brasiliensis]|uniref:Bifunctional inhibitor/plant lipid transfer protein/seed storage helical domain-containing protein n=1 Tax=Hevea brasiliensis TaxID=3981 RepID=A0A6A6LHQ9_HEVBR|nr:hypothetical protein GH714_007731 [Hevea brasiliensis]
MLTLRTAAIVAFIFSSTLCTAYAQAPSPAQFPPSAPSPLGPSSAPTTLDCMTPVLNMSDCLTYVGQPSNVTVPDKNCCPELAGLIDGSPICLCQLLSNSSLTESYGIKIDIAMGYPVPGPISGPTPSEVSTSPGLASSPSSGNHNGASNIAGSAQAFIIGFAFSFLLTLF